MNLVNHIQVTSQRTAYAWIVSLVVTPLPTRPPYTPGELVDYTVQSGDTMPALASRFNTSIEEIREANPIIPEDTTTLPPGMPMEIPIYYEPLWGTSYQIFPDSHYASCLP
jgi:LysM repeat protein